MLVENYSVPREVVYFYHHSDCNWIWLYCINFSILQAEAYQVQVRLYLKCVNKEHKSGLCDALAMLYDVEIELFIEKVTLK